MNDLVHQHPHNHHRAPRAMIFIVGLVVGALLSLLAMSLTSAKPRPAEPWDRSRLVCVGSERIPDGVRYYVQNRSGRDWGLTAERQYELFEHTDRGLIPSAGSIVLPVSIPSGQIVGLVAKMCDRSDLALFDLSRKFLIELKGGQP